MASDLLRTPDERSGPAILDREPVVLPEQRKKAATRVREMFSSSGSNIPET